MQGISSHQSPLSQAASKDFFFFHAEYFVKENEGEKL